MIYAFDEFELDAARLELRRGGQPLKGDTLILRLLAALLREAGQLVTKDELIERVWDGRAVSENVITVAMVRLRKALGQRPGEREFVKNVHGRGYRFVRPVSRLAEPLVAPAVGAIRAKGKRPFVGRANLIGRLHEALLDARAGRGGMCALTGEPGIGKTRALEEFAREAETTGCLVAWGYCHEAADTPPLWPFIQLVREVLAKLSPEARACVSGPELVALQRLVPALDPTPQLARAAAESETAPRASYTTAAKHRVFDAFIRVLARAAEQTPCLLILDDLQRADASSLELLRCWIDQSARTRLLLAATTRWPLLDAGAGGGELAQVLGHRSCTRIGLAPLADAQVAEYVGASLDDPHGSLAEAVFLRSEGNPFFMVELVRELEHDKLRDPGSLRVPEAALELVRQRVHALDAAERGVLSCAAVTGRSFDLALLGAITGEEPSALMASLDAAVAAHVVVNAAGSRTAFGFAHELLKDVLYEAIPPAQRRRVHLRTALALEERQRAGADVAASLIAYHFYMALPDADLRATVSHCIKAADAAAAVCAYADALRYLGYAREALALIPQGSPRLRMGLLLQQALLARVCASSTFEPLIRQLIRDAREQRASEMLGQGALLLAPNPGLPGLRGARAALEDCLSMLSPDDASMRGALLAQLARLGPLAYDAPRSTAQIDQALQLGEQTGALRPTYNVYIAKLYVQGGPAHRESQPELFETLERMCRENAQFLTVPPLLLEVHRAISALQDGNPSLVATILERAEVRCSEVHSHELLWHVRRLKLLSRINEGRAADAIPTLAAFHAETASVAHGIIAGSPLLYRYDRAIVLGERAAPPADEREDLGIDPDDPPSIWSLKLRVLARLDRADEARSGLRLVAPAQLARLPCDRDYLGTLGALARVAVDLGARDYAEALVPLLEAHPRGFAAHFSFLCEGSTHELVGRLLQLLGRRREATRQLELAVARSEAAGLERCAAQARLALAACRDASISN